MKLLELYGHMADDFNWVVSSEGFVSKKIPGREDVEPLLIKGNRLAYPTDELIKRGAGDNVLLFHPLREDPMHPDTDVIDIMRLSINTKLNITTCWLMTHLLYLATSPDDQAKMDPDQHAFLSLVKQAKDDTIEDMKKIMGGMKLDAKSKTTVSIFTKKGGMFDGKKHTCVGVVKFPMYEELISTLESKEKPEVFGIKLSSKKNRDTLIAVMKYIFPNIDKAEAYNYGSNSVVAAFPDALMHSYAKIAADINAVIDLFADLLVNPEEFRIKGEWTAAFDNLGNMLNEVRMVPHQISDAKQLEELQPAKAPGLKAPVNLGSAKQAYVQAEEPKLHTGKGLDFAAFMDNQQAKARQQQAQTFGFGGNAGFGRQQQPSNQHPAFAALAENQGFGQQQQRAAHPFSEFQQSNRNSFNSGGGFGNSNRGSFGGGGFGGGGRGRGF